MRNGLFQYLLIGMTGEFGVRVARHVEQVSKNAIESVSTRHVGMEWTVLTQIPTRTVVMRDAVLVSHFYIVLAFL